MLTGKAELPTFTTTPTATTPAAPATDEASTATATTTAPGHSQPSTAAGQSKTHGAGLADNWVRLTPVQLKFWGSKPG